MMPSAPSAVFGIERYVTHDGRKDQRVYACDVALFDDGSASSFGGGVGLSTLTASASPYGYQEFTGADGARHDDFHVGGLDHGVFYQVQPQATLESSTNPIESISSMNKVLCGDGY